MAGRVIAGRGRGGRGGRGAPGRGDPVALAPAGGRGFRNPFEIPLTEKMWTMGTAPFTDKFNGDKTSYMNFMTDFKVRVEKCRMNEICTIATGDDDADGNPITKHIANETGQVTLEQVIAARDARNAAPEEPDNAKKKLLAEMMYLFLVESITGSLKAHVGVKINAGLIKEDGPTLFKVISTQVSGLANVASVRNAKAQIRRIALKAYNNDIHDMHTAIGKSLLLLSSNNDSMKDEEIVHIMIEAYKKAKNAEFRTYAEHVSTQIDEGTVIDLPSLMGKMEAKYDKLIEENTWNTPDTSAELLALRAELKDLKKKGPLTPSKHNASNKTSGKGDPPKYPPWKIKAPGKSEPKTIQREVKGESRTYHWCTSHRDGKGLWCAHEPSQCTLGAKKRTPDDTKKGSAKKPKLMANSATVDKDPYQSE